MRAYILGMLLILAGCSAPNDFSATVMQFKSPEGVEKTELSIFGTAKAVSYNGIEMQKDIEISGKTLFTADIEAFETNLLEFTADRKNQRLNIGLNQSWTVNRIKKPNRTVLLYTMISPPLQDSRVLLWTTVQETTVQLDDVQPTAWVKRPLLGGYWIFDVKEPRQEIVIGVTPPEELGNSTPEEIAYILMSKVSGFNLVLLGKPGTGSVVTVIVPLAEAGKALGNRSVESSLFK